MTEKDQGWITLHRRIMHHWVWQEKPFSYGQAWTDILLECNHAERKQLIKKKLITTSRGQSSNSLRTWAERWGWSVSATRHFFDLLKSDKMISMENMHVTTRLSVLNYDTYQLEQHAEGTQSESEKAGTRISQGFHEDTNNNDNNENNDNIQLKSEKIELQAIVDMYPPNMFSNMAIPNLLLKVKKEHGVLAFNAICDKVHNITDPKKRTAPYVKSIIKNTDLEGIKKGTADASGERLEWLTRAQCASRAEKSKTSMTTDQLYTALRDGKGNIIKFEKGHRYEGESVWVKK